ncbi:hypothetical protein ACS0TY_006370 [Phlomoides rotata]
MLLLKSSRNVGNCSELLVIKQKNLWNLLNLATVQSCLCLVDETTGSIAAKPGQPSPSGLPPISDVRLEQMSKAVRWLVIELQQESGARGTRMWRQGANVEGDIDNFIETEQLLEFEGYMSSFLQARAFGFRSSP